MTPASRNARRKSSCNPEAVLRCVIVDDSPRFLAAASGLLARDGTIEVVGVASSGDDAVREVRELRPDITLVDIDLGSESGFDMVRRLHHEAGVAASRLVLISTHAEDDYAELIAASPAAGFLPKASLSAAAVRDMVGG